MSLPDFSVQHVGNYELTAQLSTGATSSVYSAILRDHPEHPEKFAIKCICKDELTPNQLLQRTAEVFHHQLVTGCSPNVLPLKEIVNEELYLFIVFNLCEGDLFQAIWDSRLYQRNDALIKETFIAILDGVYACHMRGVFHQDLKPENILVREGGADILIADFGLATRQRICRGRRCGTPDYMSPEQWAQDIVYYPSLADIWSLGIILINLVTGRRPWKAASVTDIQFGAFLDDENYLYNTFPISRSLNEVLKQILCLNPIGRLQILKIREVIMGMNTFYRMPWSNDNTMLGQPREVSMIQEQHLQDSGNLNGQAQRANGTKCRPTPKYRGPRQQAVHEVH